MILWVLNNLNIREDDLLVIVYNPDFIPEPYWVEVNSQYPNVRCARANPTSQSHQFWFPT